MRENRAPVEQNVALHELEVLGAQFALDKLRRIVLDRHDGEVVSVELLAMVALHLDAGRMPSAASGSLADAFLPGFTIPSTVVQYAVPSSAASSWTRSALREFVTVTVTLGAPAGFALDLGFAGVPAHQPGEARHRASQSERA